MQTGVDRFQIDFRQRYDPYPKQQAFHCSGAPYNFLGGAAGPGKTACGIVEHMIACQEFTPDDAKHVHTLMLRRTNPKLEATVLTRFRELIPSELYARFVQSQGRYEVTWLNGATTRFGSMQHDENAWDWQGQWYKIFFDELCEFTFNQWNAVSAWNRCPVSPYTTKDGAGNPIGIGAGWVRKLFVDKKPCDEMDEQQRRQYNPLHYSYFPCTYLDNPIYANDPQFLANLNNYPKAIRDALMFGSWDVVGGYFYGAFDSAENVCEPIEIDIKPWHRRWLSGDWGFEHFAAFYWHYMDDFGVVRTYKERLVKHHDPEMLAEMIVKESLGEDGKPLKFESFPFSHDAFADQTTKSYGANPNSVAQRMAKILRPYGLAMPFNSGRDKIGREQTMYNMLRKRIPAGKSDGQPIKRPAWIISSDCPKLIDCIISAPRDEKKVEQIAEFLGDDPLQGAGYGIYWILGKPGMMSQEQMDREKILATDPGQDRMLTQFKLTMERDARLRQAEERRPAHWE